MAGDCSPIERLMQTLRVHVPGATDDLLKLEVFNTVDEFFRRTSSWRYESSIQLATTLTMYDLALPADTEFVRMLAVTLDGTPVTAAGSQGVIQSAIGNITPELTFADGDATYDSDGNDLVSGLFTYSIYSPSYITVSNLPTQEQVSQPLKALMALTVGRGCECQECDSWGVPDWMQAMFFHEWLDGSLGRLYQMPAKPWSEPNKAVYHLKRFRNSMGYRKQEAPKGFVHNSPGWHYPRSSGWI